MTCKTTEKWLLLEQSGELPARKQRLLAQHLADCPACRAGRDALHTLTACCRPEEAPPVPSKTWEALRAATAAEPDHTIRRFEGVLPFPLRPVLRYAAGIMVGVAMGGAIYAVSDHTLAKLAGGPSSQSAWMARIDQLSAEYVQLTANAETLPLSDDPDFLQDVDEIASELLKLEGASL